MNLKRNKDMATITEDYVSFEIAKLLKEKGFDWNCITYYVDYEPDDVKYSMLCENNTDWEEHCYSAPTHQMVMKWLREVHKISIEITSTGYLIDNDVEWECDIKAGHRLYFKHITGEKSFESVAEKALKYTLENLI